MERLKLVGSIQLNRKSLFAVTTLIKLEALLRLLRNREECVDFYENPTWDRLFFLNGRY